MNAIKQWASELEMFPRSQSESIDHIWVASYYNQDYNALLHQYYATYKTPSQISATEEANVEYEVCIVLCYLISIGRYLIGSCIFSICFLVDQQC